MKTPGLSIFTLAVQQHSDITVQLRVCSHTHITRGEGADIHLRQARLATNDIYGGKGARKTPKCSQESLSETIFFWAEGWVTNRLWRTHSTADDNLGGEAGTRTPPGAVKSQLRKSEEQAEGNPIAFSALQKVVAPKRQGGHISTPASQRESNPHHTSQAQHYRRPFLDNACCMRVLLHLSPTLSSSLPLLTTSMSTKVWEGKEGNLLLTHPIKLQLYRVRPILVKDKQPPQHYLLLVSKQEKQPCNSTIT